ncbi:hypothetical protein E4T56_gene20496 [Termitomyces sp. T112]|nr:hypothetical protein E4T56_gene20496 [Termitomyces sp. T112]
MEVDNNSPESIMALMQLLAPPRQSYSLLPTVVLATLTNKGKGKMTAMLPSTPAQGSSTPSSTAWKMVKQCFCAKEKGKSKAKEPEPSTTIDEQIVHLLWWLYEAGVPVDIRADILDNHIVQLTISQVLNKFDIVCNQRDEAQTDLFHSALGKGKQVVSPPQLPEAKKALIEPFVFVEGFLTQRASPVPYDNDVPAGDNQRMDKHPDFKVSLPITGPASPVVAKARPLKPAAAKVGLSRSTTTKAGTAKPAITPVVADNPVEPIPVAHWNPHDEEFFVTQVQAAQAAMGAPVASDSGSNDDDDVPTSEQCILNSDSDDNTNEHHHKKQHNANAKQLLTINAEKAKLDLKHLNDTVFSHLPDS